MKDLIIAWCEFMEEPEFDIGPAEADDKAWFFELGWVDYDGKPTEEGRKIFKEYGVHV